MKNLVDETENLIYCLITKSLLLYFHKLLNISIKIHPKSTTQLGLIKHVMFLGGVLFVQLSARYFNFEITPLCNFTALE